MVEEVKAHRLARLMSWSQSQVLRLKSGMWLRLLPTSEVLVTTLFYIYLLAITLPLFQLLLHNQTFHRQWLRNQVRNSDTAWQACLSGSLAIGWRPSIAFNWCLRWHERSQNLAQKGSSLESPSSHCSLKYGEVSSEHRTQQLGDQNQALCTIDKHCISSSFHVHQLWIRVGWKTPVITSLWR